MNLPPLHGVVGCPVARVVAGRQPCQKLFGLPWTGVRVLGETVEDYALEMRWDWSTEPFGGRYWVGVKMVSANLHYRLAGEYVLTSPVP